MNRARLTNLCGIAFFLAGAALFYGAVRIALPSAAATRSFSMLRVAILTADQIEVSVLSNPQTTPATGRYRTKAVPHDYAITSTRLLTAEQTKEFLGILETKVFFTNGGAMCHDPGFLLRFRRQGRNILTSSLCLDCTNFEVEPFPFAPIWISIRDPKVKGPRLPQLENFFAKP